MKGIYVTRTVANAQICDIADACFLCMWEIHSDTGWKLWNFLQTEFETNSLMSISTKIWKAISFTEFVRSVVEGKF
jgi:hypothetical protein